MLPPTDMSLAPSLSRQSLRWGTRRDQILVRLGYTAFLFLALWLASHFVRALLLLMVGALIAYALYPAVRFFTRFLPCPLTLLVVYLLLVMTLGALVYLGQVQHLLTPGTKGAPAPLISFLEQLGFSQDQITSARAHVVKQLEGLAQALLTDGYVEWRKAPPREFATHPVAVGAAAVATATPPAVLCPWRRPLPPKAMPRARGTATRVTSATAAACWHRTCLYQEGA